MADAPHAASLTVFVGPLKGHRHTFEDVVEEVLIGSDPDCQLCLDLPGVSPIHARVWLEVGGATVHDTHSPAGVFVNDDRVTENAPLRDGDFLWLGSPGAEESVLLQFRGRAPQEAVAVPSPAGAAAPTSTEEVWVIEEAPEGLVSPEASEGPGGGWFTDEAGPTEAAPAGPAGEVPPLELAEEASEAQEFFFEDEPAPSQPTSPPASVSALDEFLLDDGAEVQPVEEPVFEVSDEASFLVEEPPAAPRPAAPAPPSLEWDEEALVAVDAVPQAPRPQAPPVVSPAAPLAPLPVSPAALPSPLSFEVKINGEKYF